MCGVIFQGHLKKFTFFWVVFLLGGGIFYTFAKRNFQIVLKNGI